jgi:hypothetical protein
VAWGDERVGEVVWWGRVGGVAWGRKGGHDLRWKQPHLDPLSLMRHSSRERVGRVAWGGRVGVP